MSLNKSLGDIEQKCWNNRELMDVYDRVAVNIFGDGSSYLRGDFTSESLGVYDLMDRLDISRFEELDNWIKRNKELLVELLRFIYPVSLPSSVGWRIDESFIYQITIIYCRIDEIKDDLLEECGWQKPLSVKVPEKVRQFMAEKKEKSS